MGAPALQTTPFTESYTSENIVWTSSAIENIIMSTADCAEFKAAAAKVRNLVKTPSNDEFSEMYSLFKQASEGDCNKDKPSAVNIKDKAKWDAWNGRKGMSQADAVKAYIAAADKYGEKYGVKS